ncbi:hypothetical protein Plhal304r1_c012g0047321 [Plasmopara halstedii]
MHRVLERCFENKAHNRDVCAWIAIKGCRPRPLIDCTDITRSIFQ